MARKVAAQRPQRRRTELNRAQLKALAARQAMTTAALAQPEQAPPGLDLSAATPRSRRVVLTREQEFRYIRADLIRLFVVAAILFAILVVLYFVLR